MNPTLSLRFLAVSAFTAVAAASFAQTAAHPTAHPTTTAHPVAKAAPTAPPCASHPELSSKIPALPTGLPCIRPLYTITIDPPAKLTYVSPIEGSAPAKTLGLETSSFSLDYVDTLVGTGPLAEPDKWYTIHYTGYLAEDGTKFDSSLDRKEPIVIHYGQDRVIPGWNTGFAGMHVGGKRRLYIPYQLAYGAQGKPPIPPKAELVFDVELVAQSDEKPAPPPKPATPAPAAAPAPKPTAPAASTPAPAAEPAKTPNPETH